MNAAQLHLAINHVPVIVPIVGAVILLAGIVRDSRDTRAVGLWIFLATALAVLPVYLSGEPAEDVLKNYPGVVRAQVDEHQRSALPALTVVEGLGAASAVVLVSLRRRRRVASLWWRLLFALCLVASGLLLRTAHLGGLIRHEEIQDRGF